MGVRGPLIILVAYALDSLGFDLMNLALFPLFDGVFPYVRDVEVLTSAAVLFVLVAIVVYRPSRFDERLWAVGALAGWFVGFGCTMAALHVGSAGLLLAGAVLNGASQAVLDMYVFVACCAGLRGKALFVGLPLAFIGGSSVAVTGALPTQVLLALYFAMPLVSFALAYRTARPLMAAVRSQLPMDEGMLLNPASYLSLASRFFVYLVLFRAVVALGCALARRRGPR